MIKPWKFIARKHIFQHPRLQLAEDTVALPNGKEISYLREAPAKTHSVAIIAINADGHILLQKEYSYPPNTVLWQLPGGAIESGESIIDAARRELAEESGFTANNCTVIGSYLFEQSPLRPQTVCYSVQRSARGNTSIRR